MSLPAGLLLLPAQGTSAVPPLRRKAALLTLRRLLTLEAVDAPYRAPLQRLQRQLQGLAAGAAGKALVRAVGSTDVLTPLLCLESGDPDPSARVAEAVPALLVALRHALPSGVLREAVLWDAPCRQLPDPEAGWFRTFEPPGQGVLLEPTALTARDHRGAEIDLTEDAPRSFHRLLEAPSPHLATVDTNPRSMLEAHPDKAGNAVDLGGRTIDAWRDALNAALATVEVALPALHRELLAHLQRVVPVGFEPERHLSASYLEAPGLVYLTLHPSPLTLAEALVHETQHGKLNLLRWFDAVLDNGHSEWTPSPVRPDLRPLMGVLMAVHAFVPVAALHRRLAELEHPLAEGPHFARRRGEVLAANTHGLQTLRAKARPTATGRRLLADLEALHRATREGIGTAALPPSSATVEALG